MQQPYKMATLHGFQELNNCNGCFLFTRFLREMGYELNRFEGDVDEELVCPICSGVLEEPLQVIIPTGLQIIFQAIGYFTP